MRFSRSQILLMMLFIFLPLAEISIAQPLQLGTGPHLFIDDYLIARQSFLSRSVNQPKKIEGPVVTGGEDGDQNFQPWMSVLRDEETGRFRMWYNKPDSMWYNKPKHSRQSHIGYIESEDGINWIRPHRMLKDPHGIKCNVSVIDRGKSFEKPDERYVLGFYHADGMKIAVSPDGLDWKMLTDKTVVKHTNDCNSLAWDPIRKQYLMVVQTYQKLKPEWTERRRIPHQSVSKNLLNWEPIWPIIMPKTLANIEKGETQFYAMSGVIARGDLLIGLVKVLRDDLNATPGKTAKEMGEMKRKAAGIGYTVLAWSRDGKTWQRDHEVFITQNPIPGTWDHANAWGTSQLVVNDETYLYYSGYASGHKVGKLNERQIGLTIMPRDRYAAREADLNEGTLFTKLLILDGQTMTVNADVLGEMRVRLLDENGSPLKNFDWVNIKGDSVTHSLAWGKDIQTLEGKKVSIEFRLKDAQLFGFDLYE